jgi:hypothetical protein
MHTRAGPAATKRKPWQLGSVSLSEPTVGFYALDLASAYRFVPLQLLDLWCHCFLWLDSAGRIGICTDTILCFGGAYGLNRFERITTMLSAHILRCIAKFDATCPQ